LAAGTEDTEDAEDTEDTEDTEDAEDTEDTEDAEGGIKGVGAGVDDLLIAVGIAFTAQYWINIHTHAHTTKTNKKMLIAY
jgi:hypothetical protein